jgi:ribosomal protein L7/L12
MSAQDPKPLPTEVILALQRGNLIQAIKLLRTAGNFDLKQAKAAIEQHLDRGKTAKASAGENFGALVQIPAVAEALRKGNKVEAIRILREKTGLGLKEAKAAIDRFAGHSMGEPSPPDASTPYKNTLSGPGLAPGEVPEYKTSSRPVLIALIIIGALIYYVLYRFG